MFHSINSELVLDTFDHLYYIPDQLNVLFDYFCKIIYLEKKRYR